MTGQDVRLGLEVAVRREIYGPLPGDAQLGAPLDIAGDSHTFATLADARGEWYDAATGEEIVVGMKPKRRYGVGVLYPASLGTGVLEDSDSDEQVEDGDASAEPTGEIVEGLDRSSTAVLDLSDDFDMSETQARRPSALAVTSIIRLNRGSLVVRVQGATYRKITVHFQDGSRERVWWVREPFDLYGTVPSTVLLGEAPFTASVELEGERNANLEVNLHARGYGGAESALYVTAVLANRAGGDSQRSEIFQSEISVAVADGGEFLPYGAQAEDSTDEESAEIALMYRGRRSYAVGHGCAASWEVSQDGNCASVRSDVLPTFEVLGITPEISDEDGKPLGVGMGQLASCTREELRDELSPLVAAYARWIQREYSRVDDLGEKYTAPARRLRKRAERAQVRMAQGLDLLASNESAAEAFRLMNLAMASQQRDIGRPLLKVVGSSKSPHFESRDYSPSPAIWRPFQIGFLLTSLAALFDPTDDDRDTVDLIFFPTGGGKTEAYLAAAAFHILCARFRDPTRAGVTVIMRYTLRLLSTQQFQRSAALICALEVIRRAQPELLGVTPISLGLWVGRSVSPNKKADAVARLNSLRRQPLTESNPFLLDKCPHCGAQMGVARDLGIVVGYELLGNRVGFVCRNRAGCKFSTTQHPLPIYLVDDDVYEFRPTFLIATVDKFAMLARVPEARAIFNLDENGDALADPPGLIIQDELHLIAGPLGSMVGLYEPVIETLCTKVASDGSTISPKIIGATATIRRYREQISALYGRARADLFPPQGLDADDSFFAKVHRSADGTPKAGRKYLGVYAAGFTSMQTTQVRVAAAISQASVLTDPSSAAFEDSDPYWTSVWFFNSLRELGNTLSLVQSDIPDYLTGMAVQGRVDAVRFPRRVIELTSRRDSEKIPEALRELEAERWNGRAVDICLASSIMEVGVDVSRLSLLTIVGQPKTTAQYIQVSGRVGRRGDPAPGLVVTLYSTMRSRDRSHFERFRTYHESLYAQVEPGSVTPFALPTLRRALHGPIVAYIRMRSPLKSSPTAFPEALFQSALDLLINRASTVDSESEPDIAAFAEEFRRLWKITLPGEWSYPWRVEKHYGAPLAGIDRALMRGRSDPIAIAGVADQSKMTPTSMRNVDAESLLVAGGNPYGTQDLLSKGSGADGDWEPTTIEPD